jgi:hypothetical protein
MAKKSISRSLDLNSLSLDDLVEIANDILALKEQRDALVKRLSTVGRVPTMTMTTPTASAPAPKKRAKVVGTRTSSAIGGTMKFLAKLVKDGLPALGHHKTNKTYGTDKALLWYTAANKGEGLKKIDSIESAVDKEKVQLKVQDEVQEWSGMKYQDFVNEFVTKGKR